jgi:hypothetical protein
LAIAPRDIFQVRLDDVQLWMPRERTELLRRPYGGGPDAEPRAARAKYEGQCIRRRRSGLFLWDSLLEWHGPHALHAAPAQANLSQTVPLGLLGFVYLYVGASDRVLDFSEGLVEAGYLNATPPGLLWSPSYAPVRKTERFKTFVRKAGMLDYWRARGWPDHCRPTTADDFACD